MPGRVDGAAPDAVAADSARLLPRSGLEAEQPAASRRGNANETRRVLIALLLVGGRVDAV
jgi:hypothetical protein